MTSDVAARASEPTTMGSIVRFARTGEEPAIVSLLQEAASWSSRFGTPIWTREEFIVGDHRSLLEAGELVCGFQDGRLAATMRLQSADDLFWPEDRPGDALYIHKLAVDRSFAGQGWPERLIRFASDEAIAADVAALKLDTVPLPRMLQLYERLGFVLVDGEARDFAGRRLVRLARRI